MDSLPHPALRGNDTPPDDPILPSAKTAPDADTGDGGGGTATLEREPSFDSPHTHTPSLQADPLVGFDSEPEGAGVNPVFPIAVMFQQADAWAKVVHGISRNFAMAWVFVPMLLGYYAMTIGTMLNASNAAGVAVPGSAILIMAATGLIGCALGTLMAYAINGTFFKIRLLFCGVPWSEAPQARRVWAMAYFPMVLPFFLMPFAPVGGPMALIKGPFLMIYAIAVPLAMGWSAVTSYTGVRTLFPMAGRISSTVWFLVLPMLFALVSLAGSVTLPMMMEKAIAPDLANAYAYEEGDIRFEYAGNWMVRADDPDSSIRIQPILQDAHYEIAVYDSMNTAQQELQVTIDRIFTQAAAGVIGDSSASPAQRGAYTGFEQTIRMQSSDGPRTITTFVSDLGRGCMLEIQFAYPESEQAMIEPGFQLIERTLFIIR